MAEQLQDRCNRLDCEFCSGISSQYKNLVIPTTEVGGLLRSSLLTAPCHLARIPPTAVGGLLMCCLLTRPALSFTEHCCSPFSEERLHQCRTEFAAGSRVGGSLPQLFNSRLHQQFRRVLPQEVLSIVQQRQGAFFNTEVRSCPY